MPHGLPSVYYIFCGMDPILCDSTWIGFCVLYLLWYVDPILCDATWIGFCVLYLLWYRSNPVWWLMDWLLCDISSLVWIQSCMVPHGLASVYYIFFGMDPTLCDPTLWTESCVMPHGLASVFFIFFGIDPTLYGASWIGFCVIYLLWYESNPVWCHMD